MLLTVAPPLFTSMCPLNRRAVFTMKFAVPIPELRPAWPFDGRTNFSMEFSFPVAIIDNLSLID